MGWIEWLASPLWRSKKLINKSEEDCGYDRIKSEHSEKVPFICKFYFVIVGISGVIVFDINM